MNFFITDTKERVFGLDLMRFFAIIFVLIGHGAMLGKANTSFPWIKLINGVEIFFVLSGFLIGTILIKKYNSVSKFWFKELFSFWMRRWFRTLPNYYFVLLLNVLLAYMGLTYNNINFFNFKFLLFLQNFSNYFVNFFWESWSLTIEEWFYLFFPLFLLIVSFAASFFKISKKRIFLSVILLFFIIPFLSRFFIASQYQVDSFWLYVKIYKVVIFRIDSIAWGILAAFIKYWYPSIWGKRVNVLCVIGLIVCYSYIYLMPIEYNSFYTKVFRLYITSFGIFLMLPKFDSMKTAPPFISKIVTHISIISYSMYLLNLIVSDIITKNFPPQNVLMAWVLYVVYFICTIVFSTVLYKFFEKPMMDLREKPYFNKKI